jgi:hypothetical protein
MHRAGSVIAHVYRGVEPDIEQEPLGLYDGTIPANTSWKYDPQKKIENTLAWMETFLTVLLRDIDENRADYDEVRLAIDQTREAAREAHREAKRI